MADWLIETGIGEERALLVERGEVLAARLRWPGELEAGEIAEGVLVARFSGTPRGRARFASGDEALVDRLPREAAQGRTMRFEITRSAMGEAKRRKLAHARPTEEPARPAPTLLELVGGREVRRFPAGCWEEVWAEASEGIVAFRQGALQFSPTPAMTLVDVDGHLLPRDLALEAVDPLASSIARFGLSGSIGVDFPTLREKGDRKAVDGALGVALADWDHERTAINGFGFVQLVARLEGPSLLHRLHFSRSAAAARMLLRRAEEVAEPGVLLLTAHPQVIASLLPAWLAELTTRTGREVRLAPDPGLAPHAAFAQAVAR